MRHIAPFSLVPTRLQALLDSSSLPWCVAGGAVRDTIRGVTPNDLDIISFETTRNLVAKIQRDFPSATVKAPYVSGGQGRGKRQIPINQWICISDVEQLVIHIPEVPHACEIWSALEHGWTAPPKRRIEEFDLSCNAVAVWTDGTISADDEVLSDIQNSRMRVINGPRAMRPHRIEHMQRKGFELVW